MPTGPGLRERKKQKTRWAIQEHALRLISEQGYDATTVDQIAAAAEISPSTFFRYFKSKEDLIIEDEYDPMMAQGILAAPAELTPLAAIRYSIRVTMGQMDKAELERILERGRLILAQPALRARSLENFLATRNVIAETVARRTGRAPDDRRVQTFAGAVVGVLMAALLGWYDRGGEGSLLDMIDESLGLLEAGLEL
jgi:AcrR family transcriptional regulator